MPCKGTLKCLWLWGWDLNAAVKEIWQWFFEIVVSSTAPLSLHSSNLHGSWSPLPRLVVLSQSQVGSQELFIWATNQGTAKMHGLIDGFRLYESLYSTMVSVYLKYHQLKHPVWHCGFKLASKIRKKENNLLNFYVICNLCVSFV